MCSSHFVAQSVCMQGSRFNTISKSYCFITSLNDPGFVFKLIVKNSVLLVSFGATALIC